MDLIRAFSIYLDELMNNNQRIPFFIYLCGKNK